MKKLTRSLFWKLVLSSLVTAFGGIGLGLVIRCYVNVDFVIFLLLYLCAVVVFCTGLILSKGTGDKVSAEREERPEPEKSPENNE